ncbi:putative WRKY transcription factor 25 [Raphanus sativus]|uniref:Probable WRKY transcription factor 25 isoform X1 n=1 Tax=Raphanus sativus TaxID=3726 RepID=A0A6J0MNM1_RAPSA|nr:probable WRKY transcription factor 25 isoform X1 [Raphanus sativus]XP_056861713.1 probable WRKY transcription factor 25 isoform X1 [Raphanus sativus]KAJ4866130.1 putative WRKY transcription factor 25 [Raphanus sativus]KAJ4907390.1 putative WRKY transcription factor 25 [Raphanus sativus]
MSSTSFTDLLASSGVDFHEEDEDFLGGFYPEITGLGLPKFKTAQPPPLPISQSFAFSDLPDSPLLLSSSHSLISPTTGAFPFQGFNGINNHSDIPWQLQSQTQTSNASSALQETYVVQDLPKKKDPVSREFSAHSLGSDRQVKVPSYMVSRNSNDGYGWRKYGQKQVKKSENPRSYFKCTYPNCVSKKIVETASDGQITEIIYKGGHNHPKPEFTKRPSGSTSISSSSSSLAHGRRMFNPSSVVSETHDHSENSSISFDYSDLERKGFKSEYGEIDEEEEQPVIQRLKREGEDEGMSVEVSRGVKEPKVVVQTISDIDVLVDGFRWRKYGQKVVKGNTNPRSYYKCTYQGCGVRKQVERSAEDERAVLTTYEGRHNHDIPTALRRS